MLFIDRPRGGKSVTLGLVLSVVLSACGSATPAPQEPDDTSILRQQEEEAKEAKVLTASNENVKRGMNALEQGSFAEAETIFAQARKDSPEDVQAAHYHGVALEALERFNEAELAYEKAIELQPKLITSSQNLSALLQTRGKYEESVAVADAGLVIDPEDPGLLINRAYAVDLSGDPQKGNPKAILAYEKALQAAPDNSNLQFYYAKALAVNGEKEKALGLLRRIPLDGKDVPVVEIVDVYNKMVAFDECIQALSSQLEREKSVELLIYRSSCKSGAGDTKGAEADLREAVNTDESSHLAHYYLARFLSKAGKKTEANEHLKRAKELKAASR